MRNPTRSALSAGIVVVTIAACTRSDSGNVDTSVAQRAPTDAQSSGADNMMMVRGTVASASAAAVVVKTDTGDVTVKVSPPLLVFSRGPGDLAHVTPNTFVGVTSVKQPDGSEKATEIHIFPEALRGVGEGSRMMTPPAGGSTTNPSRMTNGNVSGSSSASRMSNGNVASANGSSIVVQYAGGSQTVTVPPGTTVTEIKQTTKPLATGDQVVVVATKESDGSLTSGKALLMK